MRTRAGTGAMPLGEVVASLGALLLLGSLWRPWYELRFPASFLSQAKAAAPHLGDLGPLVSQGVDQLSSAGAIPVTAWQAFEQADVVLATAAAVALGLVALNAIGALTGRLDGVIALAGLVAAVTVVSRLVSPPGSGTPLGDQLLHPATALYLGLVGAVMMLAGGVMALAGGPGPVPAAAAVSISASPAGAGEVKVWDAS
jgi:hypothetical protein